MPRNQFSGAIKSIKIDQSEDRQKSCPLIGQLSIYLSSIMHHTLLYLQLGNKVRVNLGRIIQLKVYPHLQGNVSLDNRDFKSMNLCLAKPNIACRQTKYALPPNQTQELKVIRSSQSSPNPIWRLPDRPEQNIFLNVNVLMLTEHDTRNCGNQP